MTFAQWTALYGIGLTAFLVVDLTWLGVIGKPIYDHFLVDVRAVRPDWIAAILFYALFVVGLLYFAIAPAIDAASMTVALRNGAAYGFFTYMTFELTNRAVVRDWPWGIVPIDIAWGVVLAVSVSATTYAAYSRLFA